MLKKDKKLKILLVLESFLPLFILIFIKHAVKVDLIFRFLSELFKSNWSVIGRALNSSSLGDLLITVLCIAWFLFTFFIAMGFKSLQNSGFDHNGEKIEIKSEKKDSGVTFLVTYLLPLLVDDVSTPRGFILFIVLLMMVIILMMRSDLFYQNPVLVALKYKTYEFQFINPSQDVKENKTYIAISKDALSSNGRIIKRKYIADDVFLICNE